MAKRVLSIALVCFIMVLTLACTSTPVTRELQPTQIRGEAAAARIAELIPEGWKLSRTLQAELPVYGMDFTGNGRADFVAIVEQELCNDDRMEPVLAFLYAQALPDGSLNIDFINPLSSVDIFDTIDHPLRLNKFEIEDSALKLHFTGGDDWQQTALYVFEYENGLFYLNRADTVRWHISDPNAIDQKEYDFKDYYLRSTQISDCGDITCTEIQLPGNIEALRVKLQDFKPDTSLIRFADLL